MRLEKLTWDQLQIGDRVHEIHEAAGHKINDWLGIEIFALSADSMEGYFGLDAGGVPTNRVPFPKRYLWTVERSLAVQMAAFNWAHQKQTKPDSKWNGTCPRCKKGTYQGFNVRFDHDGPCV